MRFRRQIVLENKVKNIHIIALLNVLFLLFLFFALSSGFISQPGIGINLPKALTSEAVDNSDVVISLDNQNLVYFNDKVINTEDLRNILRLVALKRQSLLIKSDKSASLGVAAQIMDSARNAGIKQINIATDY